MKIYFILDYSVIYENEWKLSFISTNNPEESNIHTKQRYFWSAIFSNQGKRTWNFFLYLDGRNWWKEGDKNDLTTVYNRYIYNRYIYLLYL